MRSVAFLMVAALVASAPTPAVAQTPPVVVAIEAPATHLSRVLLDKSGLVPSLIGEVKTTLVPRLRSQMLNGPNSGALNADQRAVLSGLMDRLPEIVDEEFRTAMPDAVAAMAQPLSTQFSAEEAEAAASFFESTVGSGFLQRLMGAAVTAAARGQNQQEAQRQFMSSLTTSEQRALSDFITSPAGGAYLRNSKAVGDAMRTASRDVLIPRLQAGIQRRVCSELPQASPACPKPN